MPRTTVVVAMVCIIAASIALVAVLAVTLRSDSSQSATAISPSDGNATSVEMVSGNSRNSPNIFSPSPAISSTAPSSLVPASTSDLSSDLPTVASSEQTSRLSSISPVAQLTTSTAPSEEASFFSSLSETADSSGGATSSGSWLSSFSSSTYGASAMPWTVDPSELPSSTPSEFSRISVTPSSSPEGTILSRAPTQHPFAPPTTSKPLTIMPSVSPSFSPSETPLSRSPSKLPTAQPSTSQPLTIMPSVSPSSTPSQTPPSLLPSKLPSAQPTTFVPSASPSFSPSEARLSLSPSKLPTSQPTTSTPLTLMPSVSPSFPPSETPLSRSPSKLPTAQPTTVLPSLSPSFFPSSEIPLSRVPSGSPSAEPTTAMPLTLMPSVSPSSFPSETALSRTPSHVPSVKPTTAMPLTVMPSVSPSFSPSETLSSHAPTESPSIEDRFTEIVDSFQVLETISHDTNAFTQGMTFSPNELTTLYESTGLYGSSDVRKVDMTSGEVIQLVETGSQYFGEGLAYFPDGKLIHITWKERTGFIFDAETLEVLEEFTFSTTRNEGWGITYDPTDDVFIVSDGSQYLHFWNSNLQQISRVAVTYQTSTMTSPQAVTNINELEWDDSTGTILANVWQTDLILRIDPQTGFVKKRYDLTNLYPNRSPSANVLNGIAIHPVTGDLWITGKLWPLMYRLQDLE